MGLNSAFKGLKYKDWNGLGMIKMDGVKTANKLLEGKPGGKKNERHRLRWIDSVQLDLKNMSVKQWRTRTLERREWATVKWEANAKDKGLLTTKEEGEEKEC
jgi:hypothetical protein